MPEIHADELRAAHLFLTSIRDELPSLGDGSPRRRSAPRFSNTKPVTVHHGIARARNRARAGVLS